MKKIAVVNRTNLKNYGSVLQVFALCEAIRKLGYDTEVVWEQGNVSRNYDLRPRKILYTGLKLLLHPSLVATTFRTIQEVKKKPVVSAKAELFDGFVEEHIVRHFYDHKNLVAIAKGDEYHRFVCGSDQIWCSTTMYVDPLMYLRFAPKQKRIAYAPSIGRDYIPNYNRHQMKKYIKEIPSVSIREDDGQRLVRELTGKNVPVVCDPTLLLSRAEWDNLASEIKSPSQPYALLYFLDEPSIDNQEQLAKFLRGQKLKPVSIGQHLAILHDCVDIFEPDCGPAEFLGLIRKAEIIITDSYHGMLFSLIYEKKFWSVERDYKQFDQSSRQTTVLSRLNLLERYVKSAENLDCSEIDYGRVKDSIGVFRERSIDYLKKAIEG